MAFELDVVFGVQPQNLRSEWTEEFARHGVDLEFYPDCEIRKWSGGFLPIKLISLPQDYLFDLPNTIQISGFEIGFDESSAHFRSASGRPIAEFILLCLGAATLTKITKGIYVDHYTGETIKANESIEKAKQEIRSYKLDKEAQVQHLFTQW